MGSGGLIDQLVAMVLSTWGTKHSAQAIREHLLNVMEAKTYFLVNDCDRVVGYLEWQWVNQETGTLRVTELIARHPKAIWMLKDKLYTLPWTTLQFKRHKLDRQRLHHRRRMHV